MSEFGQVSFVVVVRCVAMRFCCGEGWCGILSYSYDAVRHGQVRYALAVLAVA